MSALFFKERIPYFQCRMCQFVFSRPATNPNWIDDLSSLEPAYRQYLEPDAADAINLGTLADWMARFASLDAGPLLDVGCGSGKFVRFLRSRQLDVHGAEPCRTLFEHFLAHEAAFTNADVQTIAADSPSRFAIVTAFDVLEHVADPVAFLRSLAALLLPGGHLFLSTPDRGSRAAQMLGHRWHFYCPYHLSYFNRQNLTCLSERLGFRLVHFSHRGRYRSVGYSLRYLFEFSLRRPAPAFIRRFDDWHLPLNIYDTMYLCLQKAGVGELAVSEAFAATAPVVTGPNRGV